MLRALEALPGPVHVVSDSTYVVNCFRQKWWVGWKRRGWRNTQGKPVANRDLWQAAARRWPSIRPGRSPSSGSRATRGTG